MLFFGVGEFSKMKDELPESFKKGLEAMERGNGQKTTPTADKEATPTDKSKKESTPTHDKDKVSTHTAKDKAN